MDALDVDTREDPFGNADPTANTIDQRFGECWTTRQCLPVSNTRTDVRAGADHGNILLGNFAYEGHRNRWPFHCDAQAPSIGIAHETGEHRRTTEPTKWYA